MRLASLLTYEQRELYFNNAWFHQAVDSMEQGLFTVFAGLAVVAEQRDHEMQEAVRRLEGQATELLIGDRELMDGRGDGRGR